LYLSSLGDLFNILNEKISTRDCCQICENYIEKSFGIKIPQTYKKQIGAGPHNPDKQYTADILKQPHGQQFLHLTHRRMIANIHQIMHKDKVVYELAFHLNPDLEETQMRQLAQNVENYITSAGGVISFKKEPERTRLSYPIKHKKQAYFGYIHFKLDLPEKLANIDEEVRHNNDILRYLAVKVPADSGKVKFRFKPQKPRVAPEKPAEPKTPEETKELEKQLEGILENL